MSCFLFTARSPHLSAAENMRTNDDKYVVCVRLHVQRSRGRRAQSLLAGPDVAGGEGEGSEERLSSGACSDLVQARLYLMHTGTARGNR